VRAWNADEALRITKANEAWMEEHRPPGYSSTPEEGERMSILRAQQQTAWQMKDMFAWQQIHLAILCLAMASFRRFRRFARHTVEVRRGTDAPYSPNRVE
jgi:hypothetical protein